MRCSLYSNWQSKVEIKDFSVVCFNCIAVFDMPHHNAIIVNKQDMPTSRTHHRPAHHVNNSIRAQVQILNQVLSAHFRS